MRLLAALLLLPSLCFAQAPFQFEEHQLSGAGATNRADLNGDGVPDVFSPASGIYARLNDGHGNFGPVISTATDQVTTYVAVLDFNHDGKEDLLSCFGHNNGDPTSYAAIVPGNGDGSFGTAQSLPLSDCKSVASGDFNGDGHLDLAVTWQDLDSTGQSWQNNLTIFFTDGAGHILNSATATGFPSAGTYNKVCTPWEMFAGDFDKDGRVDVLINALCQGDMPSESILIFAKGNGAGSFSFQTVKDDYWVWYLNKDDVNQDGWLDFAGVAMSSGAHSTNVYDFETLISGGSAAPTQYQTHTLQDYYNYDEYVESVVKDALVADIDGDGIKDGVYLEQVPSTSTGDPNATPVFNVVILRGKADGTYDAPVKFPITGLPYAGKIGSGDFDRDGRVDLVAYYGTGMTVFLNRTAAPTCAADTLVRSVKVCSPAKLSSNNLHLLANTTTADSVTGMKVYVDNTLKLYSPNDLINRVLTIPNGGHRVTVRAWDARGSFSSARWIDVNTSFGCSTPATDRTIHYCFPTSSSTVGSPTQVVAAVRSSRTYYSTKIYVDGVLKYSTASKQLSTTLSLPAGTHSIKVQAHDTAGYFSSSISTTVR